MFHNDNKVVPFNQRANSAGLSVSGLSHYEEKQVTISSYVTEHSVTFEKPFTGVPYVVITDITSTEGLENVSVVVTFTEYTSTTINFSAPFRGTFVYRAIQDATYGTTKTVERTPRFPSVYTNVIVSVAPVVDAHSFIPLTAAGTPTSKYITFFDPVNEPSVAVTITSVTPSGIYITASADVRSFPIYTGFNSHGSLPVDVQGVVYPLGMTQEAIQAGLSPTSQTGLFKAPYLNSDDKIVNIPILAPGSMIRGVADTFVTFTPGQDLQPFEDIANPEVDAKLTNNPFYATGSAVEVTGEGFQQPLWSKNKIEIDLTPSAVQTFELTNTGSKGNYPMMYWNPNTRQYEGLGTGRGLWSGYGNTENITEKALQNMFDKQVFGFGASVDAGSTSIDIPTIDFLENASAIINKTLETLALMQH